MCSQGADGSYGTSLSYATACDPACDVMLAYKQNGRTLAPDHGFPIRMIIPGHIGAFWGFLLHNNGPVLLIIAASSGRETNAAIARVQFPWDRTIGVPVVSLKL